MVGILSRVKPAPTKQEVWENFWTKATAKASNAWEDMIGGLMAPGNALRGNYDQLQVMADGSLSQVDPRMVQDASSLAGMVGVSGGVMPKAPNTLGMFGGVMAKTADKAALETAQKMAEKGASRDEIWDATGWFKGADDKWRFEIPDSQTFFKGTGTPTELAGEWGGEAGKVYRHPALWDAYPELAKTPFKGMNEGPMGRYTPPDIGEDIGLVQLRNDLPDSRDVFLHEMQHAIQTEEGFARGASVGEYASGPMFSKAAKDLHGDLTMALYGGKLIPTPPKELIDMMKYIEPEKLDVVLKKHGFASADDAAAFLKIEDEMRTPYSQYKRTSGEVEARNVQARKDLTPEQRRAKAPWLTQDTPEERQIVRR